VFEFGPGPLPREARPLPTVSHFQALCVNHPGTAGICPRYR
jgi:hypothetical protein